jgi:probable HAF family extracellular repeat protein
VAGWSYVPDTVVDQRGHVYGFTSFIYKNGQMSALTSDKSSRAFAINNRGQVAVTDGELDFYTDSDFRTSYIQTQGQRVQINKLGGPTGVNALNDLGQATGDLRPVNSGIYGPQHAYLYSQGVTTDLGTLGGYNSFGTGINNLAQVTGSAELAADSSGVYGTHAFLYDKGHMTDLGTLGGLSSHGLGVNDRGEVVGFSEVSRSSGSTEAFLYSGGQMISLQKLIAPVVGPDWTLTEATGINERGDITGWGSFNGQLHGFVLTAVPEPEVMALALSGLACVGLRLVPGKRSRRGTQARASNANAAA